MAYSVANGAVGKSPLIDKMNLLTAVQVKEITSGQMKELVCGHADDIYPSFPVSFDECKKEITEQLYKYQKKR